MKKRYVYAMLLFIIFNVLLIMKPANNIVQISISNTQSFLISSKERVEEFFDNFTSKRELQTQNEKLKKQVQDLNKQLSQQQNEVAVLEEKNSDLSSTLAVNAYEESSYIIANVLNKKIGTNLNVLTIDKGTDDGLKEDQIVSYNGKMIGYLSDTQESQSNVILLNNESIKFNIPVSIYTDDGKVNGTIQSYDAQDNKIIIKPLTKNEKIAEHDKVYTNGYSQSQAENVYVGEINEIIEENGSTKSYAIPLDIENYDYVEVVL